MATYKVKVMPDCVWGRMPSGVARRFATESEYAEAYRDEENEIVDEMARLSELMSVEFPEDYNFMIA